MAVAEATASRKASEVSTPVVRGAALALLLALSAALAPLTVARAQEAPQAETIAADLDFPTGIAFDSSGNMFVNERPGRVIAFRAGRAVAEPLAQIPTTTSGEAGLLGIAVAPDNRSLYVFVTEPDGATNSVVRVPARGGTPRAVVQGLPASGYHNGGGVAFDRDGMLLVSNGEQHDGARSQDPRALGGKVYRFSPAGGVPARQPLRRVGGPRHRPAQSLRVDG
jgi:glucose/arabinose dehydrogenase